MSDLNPEQREHQRRRLRAARELGGHPRQAEFAQFVKPYGVKAYGELERGDKPLLAAERGILSRLLGLPERWFTAPLKELLPEQSPAGLRRQLSVMAAMIEVLVPEEDLDRIYRRLDQIGHENNDDGENGHINEEPG